MFKRSLAYAAKLLQQEMAWCRSKEKKIPLDSKKRNVTIHASYTMLSKTTEICPMKLQCCALYKRIHECIMRGQNEPRKAQWTNPPRERKLFRIDEDTIHNNIGKGNFLLSLFKIHALNVKPELPYMYWVAYFRRYGFQSIFSINSKPHFQMMAWGKIAEMTYKENIS